MSKHYAVFGHPVAHSLSPRIHAAFGKQTGIAIDYARDRRRARPISSHALADFAATGGVGANVTLPLKQAAFALCDDLTERARRAGAVNTLVRNGDGWHGDNTDGAGLVRDLTDRQALDLRGRRTCCSAPAAPRAASRRRCSMPASANCSSSIARRSAPTRWPMRSANRAACIRATGRPRGAAASST